MNSKTSQKVDIVTSLNTNPSSYYLDLFWKLVYTTCLSLPLAIETKFNLFLDRFIYLFTTICIYSNKHLLALIDLFVRRNWYHCQTIGV